MKMMGKNLASAPQSVPSEIDWGRVVRLLLTSRAIDRIEETELFPKKEVFYQFSARGHDLAQVMLGTLLNHAHDGVSAYYRSRPLLLSLGFSVEDAFAAPMARTGGFSDGRDIGVVCNLPRQNGPTVFPMAGDVGSQFTPAVGWAQAIVYRRETLGETGWDGAIAVVHAGEGAVATNGFWSALTIATTMKLPVLFYIEDNGFAISVSGEKQTPGGNIAKNLGSFRNLFILDGDGTDPEEVAKKLLQGISHVRSDRGPALIRLAVPRLNGHSGQDTQSYKSEALLADERTRDPLVRLKKFLSNSEIATLSWENIEEEVEQLSRAAVDAARRRAQPDPTTVARYLFTEHDRTGNPIVQQQGGQLGDGVKPIAGSSTAEPEPVRTNMLTSIRRTLESELRANPRVLVFGEDVGVKGGVHAATMSLQEMFGEARVFDTSLSEEGIIGRAVGMALCGLMPVCEIQFRKYADPATEQLNNCGTIRWRTANRFAAPIVVRLPGGFSKVGDPWHSVSGESIFAHSLGWQVAYPSNAEDAVGLLRAAMRSNNPTIFFEHRYLYDAPWARRPYPGDRYVLPFGKGKIVEQGTQVSMITWGAMVERCEQAAREAGVSAEIIDLRTIIPWDKELVLQSVKKTRRALIVHEDSLTAGFGGEVSATIAESAFLSLDAPVVRIATPDLPVPYSIPLMDAVVPSVERIREALVNLVVF